MRRPLLLSAVVLPIVVGCQIYATQHNGFDIPNKLPPVGTVLELKQPLNLNPDTSQSLIQFGKAQSVNDISLHKPWCQFHLDQPQSDLHNELTILPGRFTVTHAYQQAELGRVDIPFNIAASLFNIDSVKSQTLATVMKLTSSTQPLVIELKCGIFDDPFPDNYVTVNEMQRVLRDVVTFEFI